MKRYRQTFEEIEASLARIESSWMNAHAGEVIMTLKGVPIRVRLRLRCPILRENFEFACPLRHVSGRDGR